MTQASFDALNTLRPPSGPRWDLPHLEALLQSPHREAFEDSWLPLAIANQRWFGGKGKNVRTLRVIKHWTCLSGALEALWMAVRIEYGEGPGETYQVAFAFSEVPPEEKPLIALAGKPGVLVDAFAQPWFLSEILRRFQNEAAHKTGSISLMALLGNQDKLEFEATPDLRESLAHSFTAIQPLLADQSNSAALIGSSYFIKFYRRLEAGVSPEAEMVRYLGEAGFVGTPAWRGEWQLRPQGGEAIALAVITDQVANPQNLWNFLLARLRRIQPAADPNETLNWVSQLGEKTAQMHRILARGETAAFVPQPYTEGEPARLADGLVHEVAQSLAILQAQLPTFAAPEKSKAEAILAHRDTLLAPLERLRHIAPKSLGWKTRGHGDFHLGQVLVHDGGLALLDFEGEPARSLAERRARTTPLRDVAGMLRSLHYVAVAARLLAAEEGQSLPEAQLLQWHRLAHERFLSAYRAEWAKDPKASTELLPEPEGFSLLLDALLLEKAAYELRYEAQNRPDWVQIPLTGLSLLAHLE